MDKKKYNPFMDYKKKYNPFNLLKNIIISWPMPVKIMAELFIIIFLILGPIYYNYRIETEFIVSITKKFSLLSFIK